MILIMPSLHQIKLHFVFSLLSPVSGKASVLCCFDALLEWFTSPLGFDGAFCSLFGGVTLESGVAI